MEERRWTVHGLQTVSPPHGWSESAAVTLACLCCVSTVLIHGLGLVSDGHERTPWPYLGAHCSHLQGRLDPSSAGKSCRAAATWVELVILVACISQKLFGLTIRTPYFSPGCHPCPCPAARNRKFAMSTLCNQYSYISAQIKPRCTETLNA